MGSIDAMRLPVSELRTHVEDLLAEHLVSADYLGGRIPRADLADRHVVIPPIQDQRTYGAALRQIAEVVVGDGHAAELWVREHSLLAPRQAWLLATV